MTKLFRLPFFPQYISINTKKYVNVTCLQNNFKLQCSNYRPVSSLSNINKKHDVLLYNNLYGFLIINNDIYDQIFGSIQKYSTSHALTHLTDKIGEQEDNGNFNLWATNRSSKNF